MAQTLFAACLLRLGLSQPEAARLFGWRLDTVKAWAAGRNPVKDGVWAELRAYENRIVDRSETLREVLEDGVAKAGAAPDRVDAVVDDAAGLMGLADFMLNNEVLPGNIMVGVLP